VLGTGRDVAVVRSGQVGGEAPTWPAADGRDDGRRQGGAVIAARASGTLDHAIGDADHRDVRR
jgi:hypothetical protein